MYVPEDKETAAERYFQHVANYAFGLDWMRPAKPVVLTDKEAAKIRQQAYKALREQFPCRFPKGFRFR